MPPFRAIATVIISAIIPALACSSASAVLRPDLLPPEQRIGQANAITSTVAGEEVDVEFEPLGKSGADSVNQTGELAAPDGKSVLFLQDQGGNEKDRFFSSHRPRSPFASRLKTLGASLTGGGLGEPPRVCSSEAFRAPLQGSW